MLKNELTSLKVSRFPSATMGVEPLIQANLRKEPWAEHVRTTVLLYSMASGMFDLMMTADTGSAETDHRLMFQQINELTGCEDSVSFG